MLSESKLAENKCAIGWPSVRVWPLEANIQNRYFFFLNLMFCVC